MSGCLPTMAATFLAAAGSTVRIERAELHLDRLAGRRAGARRRDLDQNAGNIGGRLARIPSMISCAGGRVFQSANSNWMTPIVSSVISLEPRGCSPTRV